MPPAPTAVWLIEDDEPLRETIALTLAATADVREAFGSVEDALAWIDTHHRTPPKGGWPDVLLLDVGLPGLSGLDGLGEIKARIPATRIVMLTIHDDTETIFRALGAGASGYLVKGAEPEQLAAAVEAARGGGMLFPKAVARRVLAFFEGLRRPSADAYGLSDREREVLREMVAGGTQKAIAERLSVSPSTVNSHVQHIYEKLHVHSAPAAVAKALREQLLDGGGAEG